MDPIEKRELKRKAWMRLAAQRRRAGRLRGRVVALSLICFALLWGIVFVQMAIGDDPVLGGKERATAKRTTASAEPVRSRKRAATVEGESKEVEPEPVEEATREVEEPEPEFVEEPLVTSQS